MKLVPMHPNLPEATTALGTVVKPKQWVECAHCEKLSPLEEREWVGLTEDEIEDLTSVMFEEPSDEEVIDFALRVQAKLKEKNV